MNFDQIFNDNSQFKLEIQKTYHANQMQSVKMGIYHRFDWLNDIHLFVHISSVFEMQEIIFIHFIVHLSGEYGNVLPCEKSLIVKTNLVTNSN